MKFLLEDYENSVETEVEAISLQSKATIITMKQVACKDDMGYHWIEDLI